MRGDPGFEEGFRRGVEAIRRMSDAENRLRATSPIMQLDRMEGLRYMGQLKRGEVPLTPADACQLRLIRSAYGGDGTFHDMFGHLDIDNV